MQCASVCEVFLGLLVTLDRPLFPICKSQFQIFDEILYEIEI